MTSSLLMEAAASSSIDQLPLYTRRDPETSSIRSSAPSYVSEAPTYHTHVPSTHTHLPTPNAPTPMIGLPPTSYAPGFHRAPSYSKNDLSHLCFNISEWSSAKNGPQARHYQNVAKRRAKLASIEEQARLTSSLSGIGGGGMASLASITSVESLETTTMTIQEQNPSSGSSGAQGLLQQQPNLPSMLSAEPFSPLEDPELVGQAAATAARERRLYMAKCLREKEAQKQENKGWEFMLGQMNDWSERERSWEGFKKNVERRKGGLGVGTRFLRKFLP